MAMPIKDSELVDFSTNFSTRISAVPADFGLSAPQASAYQTRHLAFVGAYDAQRVAFEAGNRQESLTAAKNLAKHELLTLGRELYAFIQDSLTVTDANKILVGVKVKDTSPSPIQRPAFAPALEIVSVVGRTVRVKLHDSQNEARRGMPDGVIGATVVSYVGTDDPPTTSSVWRFEGNTGKLIADVEFPSSLPAGQTVWLAASWFNFRKENGPACTPISTNLQGGAQAVA